MKKRGVVLGVILVFVVAALLGYTISKKQIMDGIEHSYQADGWKFFFSSQTLRAIDEFEMYLIHDKKNYYALSGSGWSYYELEDFEKAAEFFEKAILSSIPDDFALRGLGRSYYRAYALTSDPKKGDGLFAKSESALKRAIALWPSSDAYTVLGRLYLLRARSTSAEEFYTKAHEAFSQADALNPKSAQIRNLIAFTSYAKDVRFHQPQLNASHIALLYKESLEIRPTWQAYAGLGLMQLRQGDVQSAVFNYNKSLEIAQNLEALRGLGLSLLAQGKYDEATHHFESLSKEYPGDLKVLRGLGLSLRMSGNLSASKEVFERTIRIDENYVPGYLNLMYIHFKQDNSAYAQVMLAKAISIESDLLKVNDRAQIIACLADLNSLYRVETIVGCYDLPKEPNDLPQLEVVH